MSDKGDGGPPSPDEVLARMEQVVRENTYGVMRMSPRRWAVVRRRVVTGRQLVGYGTVVRHTGIGHTLSDPKYLTGWLEYEIVEGYDKMDRDMALRAVYDLTHPEA